MAKTRSDNIKLAVAAILATCFALSLGDALIKQQSTSFVLWQIFLVRSLIAVPFIIYFVRSYRCGTSILPAQAGWTPMWLDEWRAMAILAIAIVIGSAGAAYAYQAGPPALIATFDFSYVVFATIWGFILFAEVPSIETLIGVIFIIGGGMLALNPRPEIS